MASIDTGVCSLRREKVSSCSHWRLDGNSSWKTRSGALSGSFSAGARAPQTNTGFVTQIQFDGWCLCVTAVGNRIRTKILLQMMQSPQKHLQQDFLNSSSDKNTKAGGSPPCPNRTSGPQHHSGAAVIFIGERIVVTLDVRSVCCFEQRSCCCTSTRPLQQSVRNRSQGGKDGKWIFLEKRSHFQSETTKPWSCFFSIMQRLTFW